MSAIKGPRGKDMCLNIASRQTEHNIAAVTSTVDFLQVPSPLFKCRLRRLYQWHFMTSATEYRVSEWVEFSVPLDTQ